MSFADKLVQTPRREKSGETGYERYDYQASWGLALIFESHDDLDDYAIAFEFHDDIVRLNSSSVPTTAQFYQVKTKISGHWTLTDLSRRKKAKDGTSLLPSFVGKMHDNYELFPAETERLSFVSNLPCQFIVTWWGCDVTGELPSKKFMSWGREKQNAVSKYPVAVSNQSHRAA